MADLNWWAEINLKLQKDPGATGDDQGVGVNAHRHRRTEGLNKEIEDTCGLLKHDLLTWTDCWN